MAMASFHFVDSQGTAWMILAGLPADVPEGSDGQGALPGLTFRASTGELRVLPRAAFPRTASTAMPVALFGTGSRVHALQSADWEALLRQAIVWPPT
jgi:hypothetical protein